MSTNRAILDLISNLNKGNSRGNVSISIGNGGNVTYTSGGTHYAGNSIAINQNTLSINGRNYSLDDATAADGMTNEDREMFWSLCSDKGKDSDLYREHAKSILLAANVDVNTIDNTNLKLIVINQATHVAKLGNYLSQIGNHNWLTQLSKLSDNRLEIFISKAYDTTELLKGLHQLGYSDPLNALNTTDISRLNAFLDHRYDTIELLKGINGLGYRNTLQILQKINNDKLQQMFSHRYDTLELIKAFRNLGCKDPLDDFLNINHDKLNELFNHRYDTIELMKCFNQLNYSDALKTLINLEQATLNLFYQSRYDSIEILKALYNSGKRDPIAYFQSLGKDAMITILGSRYEYINRINRGVDLAREFKPVVVVNVDNQYRPELTKFIQDISQKESNQSMITKLRIDTNGLDDCKDCCTGRIVNIPVRLDGDLFDLDFLVNLKQDQEGYRQHPLSGEKFTLRNLQSAKDIQKNLDCLFEVTKIQQNNNIRM